MDSEIITGLDALSDQLSQLPMNIQKKLLRGALRAGLKPTLLQARQSIHSISGDLADSLRISTRAAKNGDVVATLKAGSKLAFYAHMVEFGTAAHVIEATGAKAVSFNGHTYSKVEHPGSQQKPFMRPALDAAAASNSEVFQAIAAYLAPKIDKNLALLPDESDAKT